MIDSGYKRPLLFFFCIFENPKEITHQKSVDNINPVGKYKIANIY
jgi:hypothetical protein